MKDETVETLQVGAVSCAARWSIATVHGGRLGQGSTMTERNAPLAGMGTASWSAEEGTAYEVALEGISHVVGAYSRLIARAEKAGDSARAGALVAEQGAWAARRKSLTPPDQDTVAAVTAESARTLARLRGER
ncbi:hypothetical protein ACIPQJ_00165 [Streptomyces sp. NPDC090082]|uniref:hypothetical protein n=1 Tax=unclassified Streptomyces TaxID=2593676 RepID=UPI00380DB7CB